MNLLLRKNNWSNRRRKNKRKNTGLFFYFLSLKIKREIRIRNTLYFNLIYVVLFAYCVRFESFLTGFFRRSIGAPSSFSGELYSFHARYCMQVYLLLGHYSLDRPWSDFCKTLFILRNNLGPQSRIWGPLFDISGRWGWKTPSIFRNHEKHMFFHNFLTQNSRNCGILRSKGQQYAQNLTA